MNIDNLNHETQQKIAKQIIKSEIATTLSKFNIKIGNQATKEIFDIVQKLEITLTEEVKQQI